MTVVPGVLAILEDMETDIDSLPGDLVAMTPAALQAATTRLPSDWTICEGFVLTNYHIQDN